MMKNYGIPVASEGWMFIIPLAVVTVLLFFFGWKNTGIVVLCADAVRPVLLPRPRADSARGQNLVVSPADGRVIVIKDIYRARRT